MLTEAHRLLEIAMLQEIRWHAQRLERLPNLHPRLWKQAVLIAAQAHAAITAGRAR